MKTPPLSASRAALLAVATAALTLAACADDADAPAPAPAPAPTPAPAPEPAPEPVPETATYTFDQPEPLISPRVPGTLPSGVHFAPPLAMVAHAPGEAPWVPGEIASDGMKLLAEAGASWELLMEAEAAGAEVVFGDQAEMLALLLSPDPSLEVSLERPCFSYAQMIAPTPDWFVGFSDACAAEDGEWLGEIEVELTAYDAGTATGGEYQYKSADTEPREPIALLDAPPYFASPAVTMVIRATRKTE